LEDLGNGTDPSDLSDGPDLVEHAIQNILSPHRILELNCLILGQDPKHIFSVKIARTESISTLKEAIKEKKNAFRHIDADTLTVWQVSILDDGSLGRNLREINISDESSLRPTQKLSGLFSEPPIEGHLHVVVAPPPLAVIQTGLSSEPLRLLELNCFIIGDSCNNIFTVKIPKTESISTLKEVIKEKKNAFRHIDADTLIVWQVSILDDSSLGKNLGEINLLDESSLRPTQKLSGLFSEPPIQNHLHIVVKPEPARESK
jgi:hypothetical protein